MNPRTNRIFLVGIAVSFLVHAAAVAVVSLRVQPSRAQARQIQFVAVEFTRTPPPVQVQRPKTTPPPPEPPKPAPQEQAARASARPGRILSLLAGARPAGSGRPPSAASAPASSRPPSGVPGIQKSGGGELNTGTPSSNGTLNLGPGGRTPGGWVPGHGSGQGSGSGSGTGNTAPVGTGTSITPDPPSPPPAPPPPKDVRVKVCAVSGSLPGPYCEKTTTRTFQEGSEPHRTCSECKAPAPPPQHNSTQADVVKEKFLSGSSPSIPGSVRLTRSATVTCQYVVGTNGSVSDVKIVDSSGNRALDQEVIRAVKTYKYSPAMQAGTPREVTKQRSFSFQPNE